MEQAITSAALRCIRSATDQWNQEALTNLGTQDGGSKAIFIWENTSLLADFFNASFSNETANTFCHRLRFWVPLLPIKIINFIISSGWIDLNVCPVYCNDSLWYLTIDTLEIWTSKATSILVLKNFIKRLDFLRRVLQNFFTIWETVDLPTPKTLETTLHEFPVDNRHKAQGTGFWMLIVFRK